MSRVAVVTGAGRGIGWAIAERLLTQGWTVVGVDRAPGHDPAVQWLEVDLADTDALTAALADLPRVDGLVNNAAMQHARPLLDTSVSEWDAVQAVNLRAPFVAIKACAESLSAQGGAVVNIASVHALTTSSNVAPYAASKGGLLALTRAAALELADQGIRVNAVAPGAVDTPALRDGFVRQVTGDPERVLRERTPLARFGEPAEIAEAVVFLLDGERSSFITGTTLVVDGGASARLSTE